MRLEVDVDYRILTLGLGEFLVGIESRQVVVRLDPYKRDGEEVAASEYSVDVAKSTDRSLPSRNQTVRSWSVQMRRAFGFLAHSR